MGDWRKDAGESLKRKKSRGKFKLAEGENCLRVLPNAKGPAMRPFVEYNIHVEVGPDKGVVRCGKNIHGEGECWLCDSLIPKLAASKDKGKRLLAESLRSIERFAVQIAIQDPETSKFRGPYLWHVSCGGGKSLSAKLLGVIKSTKRDYVDPKKGYNLNIERTGTDKTTSYGAIIPDEGPSIVPSSILAACKTFKELIPQYSVEAQKAAYFGKAADTEEAGTEDDSPATEESGEESGEETTEEEEAPAPKPKGKKPVGKRPPVEEEEEEEVTEDGEETTEEGEEGTTEEGEEAPTEEEEEPPTEDDDGGGAEETGEEGEEAPVDDEEEERPKPVAKKPVKPAPKPVGKKPVRR